MTFIDAAAAEAIGGICSGFTISAVVGAFALRGQISAHDGAVADMKEDAQRWVIDRDRRLMQELRAIADEAASRNVFHSGQHLGDRAAEQRNALHEYRDQISSTRRRYRGLVDSETLAHAWLRRRLGRPLRALALTDEAVATLTRWREPAVVAGMPERGKVDDPTSEGREPSIRSFEREGDLPSTLTDPLTGS